MKRNYLPFYLIVIVLALAGAALAALAPSGTAAQAAPQPDLPQSGQATLPAGNYCISCHLADDPRLATVTDWKGGIGRTVNSPCAAAAAIHKELYYAERMLVMIERLGGSASLPEKMQAQLDGTTQSYSRLLDEPVTSLEAFTSRAQTVRFRLNKIYTAQTQAIDASQRRTILFVALGASAVALGSLAWGWYNTRSFGAGENRRRGGMIVLVLFLLGVVGLFTLPIFRLPAAVNAETTLEQQEAQTVLDEAGRAADAADRAQARAWMIARLASAWEAERPAQARAVLEEATSALEEARSDASALWGESLAVQEANVSSSIQLEKARLIAEELNAARGRQWSLPLIAAEWAWVDLEHADTLLEAEEASLAQRNGINRDLQLRGVALAWLKVYPPRADLAAASIADPAIRSWTQREIGALTGDRAAFEAAGESARLVADPVQRARSLRELAAVSGDEALFDEALAALKTVTGEPLAYALSGLAAASGNAEYVEGIVSPEALTAALLAEGDEEAAYQASLTITDPIEQARAQAAIAAKWGSEEKAGQIGLPLYRDMALRDVIQKTGNVSLTNSINSVYYRVQALTALGETGAALESAPGLKDSYPLIALGINLAEEDPAATLKLVDSMGSEADKAAVLRALAARDPMLFEQALGMALAARVRGDSLAPAQASLDLAQALWTLQPAEAQAALRQALEVARRITIK